MSLDLNMDNMFVSGDELEQAEQANEEQVLEQYDRFLYCEDPNTIAELATNVFGFAQSVDPNNAFFETSDNHIKWSLQAMSNNMTQFVLVEGLLSHRMKAGL